MDIPRTRYAAAADGAHIAYQVIGSGPEDLIYVPGWSSSLELSWELPLDARFLRALASTTRLILIDRRGRGFSDSVFAEKPPSLDQLMDDITVVLDAAGSERAAIFGVFEGGLPDTFAARVGLFSFDSGTPLTAGTWPAARAGAACAIDAARAVAAASGRARRSRCRVRPATMPGADFFGGYCFLNNAALAAQALRDAGARAGRGAGRGLPPRQRHAEHLLRARRRAVRCRSTATRAPSTRSSSAMPTSAARGAGAGFNLNLPLPRGTGFARWRAGAGRRRCGRSAASAPRRWWSRSGVDTFEGDPISQLPRCAATTSRASGATLAGARPADGVRAGRRLRRRGDRRNVANVLEGFED